MSQPLFGELFIDHSESERNAIHLYVGKPTPLEEQSLGRVFTIMEFQDPEAYYQDIIDSIDATFTKGYYHSSDFDVEVAFERALHRVNRAVQDAVSQHGEGWTYQCNAIIGVIKNEEVHLSYVGNIEAFLVQGNSIIDILQKSEQDEVKPLKLFTNVVSGQIGTGTSLVAASANLLDFLSLDKIRRTSHGNAPDSAVTEMEQILTENTTLSNIVALVIAQDTSTPQSSAPADTLDVALNNELGEAVDAVEHTEEEVLRNDSMDKLIDQERETGELLTPSIWPSLKKRLNDIGTNQTKKDTPQQSNYVTSNNKAIEVLSSIWRFIITVLTQIVIGLIYIVRVSTRAIRNSESLRSIGAGIRNWFIRLSTPRKILLIVAIVVIGFFLFSLVFNQQSNEATVAETNYDEVLNTVENMLGEAEAKEILNQDDAARTAVSEASSLLETVPEDSEAFLNRGTDIANRIEELNNAFNKVTKVDAQQVADFGTLEGFTGIERIEQIGDSIFGFSTQTGGVYKANIAADSVSEVIGADAAEASFIATENDSVATTLATDSNGDFVQFNPVLEKTSSVNVGIAAEELTVTEFDIFNDRLYVVDAVNSQIYKHNASGEAYATGTEWLAEGVDISGAIDVDIDNSIYVLFNNGGIRKFDGGEESEFTVADFTPGMGGATRIVKDTLGSPFYILNPTAKTLIVLNEDGSLQNQFTADAFTDMKDMVVDEANSTVYILSGSTIYSINIEVE